MPEPLQKYYWPLPTSAAFTTSNRIASGMNAKID
jgi:hypothetical protein